MFIAQVEPDNQSINKLFFPIKSNTTLVIEGWSLCMLTLHFTQKNELFFAKKILKDVSRGERVVESGGLFSSVAVCALELLLVVALVGGRLEVSVGRTLPGQERVAQSVRSALQVDGAVASHREQLGTEAGAAGTRGT